MGAPAHPSDADVIEAVTALPGATAAEVAGAIGIGRSTAAKYLARLEAAGTLRREPGGRSGGARVADRWFPAAPAGSTEAGEPVWGAPVPADALTLPVAEGARTDEPVEHAPGPRSAARLAPGALGAMVREYLAARPGESFGPSGIAKALGRSAGAVSNSLSAMAERGEVEKVAERPRRYRAAG